MPVVFMEHNSNQTQSARGEKMDGERRACVWKKVREREKEQQQRRYYERGNVKQVLSDQIWKRGICMREGEMDRESVQERKRGSSSV